MKRFIQWLTENTNPEERQAAFLLLGLLLVGSIVKQCRPRGPSSEMTQPAAPAGEGVKGPD
jgi:hypothetical protein